MTADSQPLIFNPVKIKTHTVYLNRTYTSSIPRGSQSARTLYDCSWRASLLWLTPDSASTTVLCHQCFQQRHFYIILYNATSYFDELSESVSCTMKSTHAHGHNVTVLHNMQSKHPIILWSHMACLHLNELVITMMRYLWSANYTQRN